MTERFTVYDIFAVLVPGVLTGSLLIMTAKRLAGVDILDWTGGFGDAALLVIAGYAVGVLLQAVGHLGMSLVQRRQDGIWPMTRCLVEDSGVLTSHMREQVIEVMEIEYGSLPTDKEGIQYRERLQELVYRAIKDVRRVDPLSERFQAESHQMRGLVVGLFLLTIVALASYLGPAGHPRWVYLLVGGTYAILFALSLWRLSDKDKAFAKHVYAIYLGEYRRREQ